MAVINIFPSLIEYFQVVDSQSLQLRMITNLITIRNMWESCDMHKDTIRLLL